MTAPTLKTPEQIGLEMTQTRESITEKVTALENQVVGTARAAANTLTGTVDAVKSFVTGGPEAVTQTVKQAATAVRDTLKDTFDLSGHVSRHPWGTMTASVGLGCLIGWLISRPSAPTQPSDRAARAGAEPPSVPTALPPDDKPGVVDELMAMMGDKARGLARTTLESVSTALSGAIRDEVPFLMNKAGRS
jgi:ElaB/YqjD/DUF883 family membrane-anchored ribosome-binding protein